jgi:hypothetical protein
MVETKSVENVQRKFGMTYSEILLLRAAADWLP